jgi:hypothetical protein
MNPWLGWSFAAVAVALAWARFGWTGAALATSVAVFWALLQFSRALRAMRVAAAAPVGHIDSAVMLNARLRPGLRLVEILALTRSLGRRVGESPEVWSWTDPGGASVEVELRAGRLARAGLRRPGEPSPDGAEGAP